MLKKENLIYVVMLVLLVSVALNIWTLNANTNLSNKVTQIEKRDVALLSKMDTVIENGHKIYERKTPEGNIDDIIKSDIFKNLPKDQQQYYLELKNIKGLLASSQAQYQAQGELLKKLMLKDSMAKITDSTITFKRYEHIPLSDSNSHMSYTGDLFINQPLQLKINYKYNAKIKSDFERQKDKSIVVKYELEDENAKIIGINSFIIPVEKKTKLQEFWDKHKTSVELIGGACLFSGGVYLGTKL